MSEYCKGESFLLFGVRVEVLVSTVLLLEEEAYLEVVV